MGSLCSTSTHDDDTAVAAPDGNACGGTGSVQVDSDRVIPLTVHSDAVFGVCATSLPHQSVSCGEDNMVNIFDWQEDKVVEHFRGHTRGVNKVVFGHSSQAVFSCSRDTSVRQWTAGQETEVQRFEGHTLTVSAIALSCDNTVLCSGSRDNTVLTWDVASGSKVPIRRATVSQNLVTALKWIPNENAVLQASEDLTLRVWDTQTLTVVQELRGHTDIQTCCDVSTDSKQFLTSSNGFDSSGCELKLWDRRQNCILKEFRGHTQSVTSCTFLPGNKFVASTSSDGTLKVWDSTAEADRACVSTYRLPSGRLNSIAALRPSEASAGSELCSLVAGSMSAALHLFTVNACGHLSAQAHTKAAQEEDP